MVASGSTPGFGWPVPAKSDTFSLVGGTSSTDPGDLTRLALAIEQTLNTGFSPFGSSSLEDTDLNTVLDYGYRWQGRDADATVERHYPPGAGRGTLLTLPYGTNGRIQSYYPTGAAPITKRTYTAGSPGVWSAWSAGDGVPAAPTDMVLVIGQSNSVGRGLPVLTPDQWSRIVQLPADPGNSRNLGIIPAVDPLYHQEPYRADTGIGYAVPFARRFIQDHPDAKLMLLPSSYGGTGFTTTPKTWDWTAADTSYNNLALNAVRHVQAARALVPGARLVAILWHQGEGDSAMGETAYAAKLDGLFAWIRSQLDAPDVPIVVGQMSPDRNAGNTGAQSIDRAHVATPARLRYAGFARLPAGLHNPGDSTHLSARAQLLLGQAMYTGFERARYNLPGVRPIGVEGLVVTRRGSLVDVRWSDAWSAVTSYRVEWSADGTSWQATGVTRWTANDTSATIDAPAAMQVRVISINGDGESTPVVAAVAASANARTGVRRIAADNGAGWVAGQGVIDLARTGDIVELTFEGIQNNSGTTGYALLTTLPVGFRPLIKGRDRYFTTWNLLRWRVRTGGVVDVRSPSSGSDYATATWTTEDPFPATLPGTPA